MKGSVAVIIGTMSPCILLALLASASAAFTLKTTPTLLRPASTTTTTTMCSSSNNIISSEVLKENHSSLSRRNMLKKSASALLGLASVVATTSPLMTIPIAFAADEPSSLEEYLYRIIRVREATQQERRLISTGKFKDVQRANVKLAVKFMIQNYRLADCVVGAAAYLGGGGGSNGGQSMKAIDVGQTAVQNLQTILEYFDSQDVENIKVGGSGSMGGKEDIVVKGLQATQAKIDEFLAFFPTETVSRVKAKIQEENELNVKEFDKSLGDIINLPPPS